MMFRLQYRQGLLLLAFMLSACHHQIAFDDIGYTIGSSQQAASLILVIDPATRDRVVPIRSFLTGIAQSWDVKPGEMLRQICDVEFPQMFKSYTVHTAYQEPSHSEKELTLQLTVPHYAFDDFRAFVEVHARAYGNGKRLLLDKTYSKEGDTQGGKMFFAGAFGMKSAVRQSSFDAFKKVFVDLRADLLAALEKV